MIKTRNIVDRLHAGWRNDSEHRRKTDLTGKKKHGTLTKVKRE